MIAAHIVTQFFFNALIHGCTNPGRQVSRAAKFILLAPNMWLLRMDLDLCWCLILRWLVDFWKLCGPLVYKIICICDMTAYKLLPVRSHIRPLYTSGIVGYN